MRQPLLAAVLPWVGHAQTRSRGTRLRLGRACRSERRDAAGADGARATEIHLRARSAGVVSAADAFFTGMMATVLADDELIEAVALPRCVRANATRSAKSPAGTAISPSSPVLPRGSGERARLAVGGVADRPVARDLPLPGPALDDALDIFAWELDAREDLHATARYRRELVRRIGRAVIEAAAMPQARRRRSGTPVVFT